MRLKIQTTGSRDANAADFASVEKRFAARLLGKEACDVPHRQANVMRRAGGYHRARVVQRPRDRLLYKDLFAVGGGNLDAPPVLRCRPRDLRVRDCLRDADGGSGAGVVREACGARDIGVHYSAEVNVGQASAGASAQPAYGARADQGHSQALRSASGPGTGNRTTGPSVAPRQCDAPRATGI